MRTTILPFRPFRLLTIVVLALVTVAAPATPAAGATASPTPPPPNTVTAYGTAIPHGPTTSAAVNRSFVGIATAPGVDGYWLTAPDGGVFTFGAATYHGSAGAMVLNQPVLGVAATPGGGGYWLVARDGGVFSFGDAAFHGSTGAITLNQPIVGMAATPTGDGYWLVARDGGVFSFGDAAFHGSTGAITLNQPIVGMAATPTGDGYWLAAADAGIFAFGDARFFGSAGEDPVESPITAIAASPDGDGYWLVAQNGEVLPFGVTDEGGAASDSEPSRALTVGIAAHGPDGYWLVHGQAAALGVDDRGPDVRSLQQRLRDLGYWVGSVDGVYGTLTRQAVYAFQKVQGLPVSGQADGTTREVLRTARRPVPANRSGSRVEVDKARQVLLVVRDGHTRWAFNTSTGTEDHYTYEDQRYLADTPPGRWTFDRAIDGYRTSDLGRLYRPRYFHVDGIAIHGSTSVPPYPASHGCVRLTNAAMDFVWSEDLAPLGSEIVVHGTSPG